MKSHYDTLSVSQTAPTEVIRAAYKALSQKHHPDKGGNAETMADINEAWRVLSDPDGRAGHDMQLSFVDLTKMPFSTPRPASPVRPVKPAPPTRPVDGTPFEVDEAILRKARPYGKGNASFPTKRQYGGILAVLTLGLLS
jgi:curved DNA-binding protein CbpA